MLPSITPKGPWQRCRCTDIIVSGVLEAGTGRLHYEWLGHASRARTGQSGPTLGQLAANAVRHHGLVEDGHGIDCGPRFRTHGF